MSKGKRSQSRKAQRSLEKALFGSECRPKVKVYGVYGHPAIPRVPQEPLVLPSEPAGNCRYCGNRCFPWGMDWTCMHCHVTYPATEKYFQDGEDDEPK